MTTPPKCASTFLALGLFLATTGAASAKDVTIVAEPPEGALTERVSYADLNLASAADVKVLSTRVGGAVRRVCSPLDQRWTYADYGTCKSFAWDGARPQMDQAIARAQQIAAVGTSSIAPVAILIAAPQH